MDRTMREDLKEKMPKMTFDIRLDRYRGHTRYGELRRTCRTWTKRRWVRRLILQYRLDGVQCRKNILVDMPNQDVSVVNDFATRVISDFDVGRRCRIYLH